MYNARVFVIDGVENGDSDPLVDGYGYGTRLNTVGRAEGLSESCDTQQIDSKLRILLSYER